MPPTKAAAAKKGTSGKGRSQKHPQDLTGRRMEEANRAAAEKAAQDERDLIAAANAEEREKQNTVVEMAAPGEARVIGAGETDFDDDDVDLDLDDIEEASDALVTIILIDDLRTTIGYGKKWEFEGGRRYRVPPDVADHLDEKGWLTYRGR
jgi:hypothetical protein